jgi:predicted ArsR family transcriptional regulator
LPFSVREAATALRIGRSTACRAFEELQQKGFVRIGKASGFNLKGRVSTEWLLTEFPDDREAHALPTKDFMKWSLAKSFHSPTSGPVSPTSEPVRVL